MLPSFAESLSPSSLSLFPLLYTSANLVRPNCQSLRWPSPPSSLSPSLIFFVYRGTGSRQTESKETIGKRNIARFWNCKNYGAEERAGKSQSQREKERQREKVRDFFHFFNSPFGRLLKGAASCQSHNYSLLWRCFTTSVLVVLIEHSQPLRPSRELGSRRRQP